MPRNLAVVRLRTVSHEEGWHWSLRLDPTGPGSGACFFDATMGFGWDGFKQREREFPRIAVAVEQLPIIDEFLIGEIAEHAIESTLKSLRTFPVSTDDAWNCQDWARECVKLLHKSQDIRKEDYDVFCAWNDQILSGYDVTRPG